MKALVSLIIATTIVSFTSLAGRGLYIEYTIKKDTFDKTVKKGYTRIYGKVTKDGKPVEGARVSSINHKEFAITKKDGSYSFLVKSSDSSIYAYKPYHEEIVINKINLKDQHKTEIDFYMKDNASMMIMDKPVIYMYAEDDKKVKISLSVNGKMTYSYPSYNKGWNVTAQKEGGIKVNGENYPYLFWEGENTNLKIEASDEGDHIEGFIVEAKTTISFLEDKLTKLGLNQREKTDFITFWGPRMRKYEKTIVQFLVDEEYDENIAKLAIQPLPNSSRRIYILFQEYLGSEDVKPQKLEGFERGGFTFIEWGGSEITTNKKSL